MEIGIIGGTKGLGKTIATFLSQKKFDITVTGRDKYVGENVARELGINYSDNNIKTASLSDIVIVAVPISNTIDVIVQIGKYLKKGSLMIDVTSVKEKPSKAMSIVLGDDVEFIPTHPIFGPRTQSLDGQVIVLTPIKKGKWYPKIFNFLKECKMRVIESKPEEHDYMMSIVQILTHFSYISIALAIKQLGVDIKETRKFSSPIYNLMVDIISRIVSQNPFLIYSIQIENNNGKIVRDAFLNAVTELNSVLSFEDEKKFVEMVISATKNMDDIQSAVGRSDKAIESLTRELSLLKEVVGEKIVVQHIYSKKLHSGILSELTPDSLILDTGKVVKELKIANIKILSDVDLVKWKLNNNQTRISYISCVFLDICDEDVIAKTICDLKEVVNVKVTDIYKGAQIEEGFVSITFEIESFDISTMGSVERLLKGFGGIIR